MQLALVVLAALIAVALVWNWLFPYAFKKDGRGARLELRRFRYPDPIEGCNEADMLFCGDYRHGACNACGTKTHNRAAYVEDGSLRRRVGFLCLHCELGQNSQWAEQQKALRRERRVNDLNKVTTPPQSDHVSFGIMPDQYAGPARDAIRAFIDSDAQEAVVDGISAATLNDSIATVAFDQGLYAETRDGETVLRKVDA